RGSWKCSMPQKTIGKKSPASQNPNRIKGVPGNCGWESRAGLGADDTIGAFYAKWALIRSTAGQDGKSVIPSGARNLGHRPNNSSRLRVRLSRHCTPLSLESA